MRRRLVIAAPFLLASCSVLPKQPYLAQRNWPLVIRRPQTRPARRGGRVLLVRTLNAGPGLETRGLKTLHADGSMSSDFYEQWVVPPAQAVQDDLQHWLAASGIFAAVVGQGSLISADLVLEGELTALWAEPEQKRARATISYSVLNQKGIRDRVVAQAVATAAAPLAGTTAPQEVAAERQALIEVFGQIEHRLARLR